MVLLGDKIKALRTSYNLTQTDFAKKLNISKSTVSSYENDSRLPSYDVLIKISKLFNVSIDSLLTDNSNGLYIDTTLLTKEQISVLSHLLDVFKQDNQNNKPNYLKTSRIDELIYETE